MKNQNCLKLFHGEGRAYHYTISCKNQNLLESQRCPLSCHCWNVFDTFLTIGSNIQSPLNQSACNQFKRNSPKLLLQDNSSPEKSESMFLRRPNTPIKEVVRIDVASAIGKGLCVCSKLRSKRPYNQKGGNLDSRRALYFVLGMDYLWARWATSATIKEYIKLRYWLRVLATGPSRLWKTLTILLMA